MVTSVGGAWCSASDTDLQRRLLTGKVASLFATAASLPTFQDALVNSARPAASHKDKKNKTQTDPRWLITLTHFFLLLPCASEEKFPRRRFTLLQGKVRQIFSRGYILICKIPLNLINGIHFHCWFEKHRTGTLLSFNYCISGHPFAFFFFLEKLSCCDVTKGLTHLSQVGDHTPRPAAGSSHWPHLVFAPIHARTVELSGDFSEWLQTEG